MPLRTDAKCSNSHNHCRLGRANAAKQMDRNARAGAIGSYIIIAARCRVKGAGGVAACFGAHLSPGGTADGSHGWSPDARRDGTRGSGSRSFSFSPRRGRRRLALDRAAPQERNSSAPLGRKPETTTPSSGCAGRRATRYTRGYSPSPRWGEDWIRDREPGVRFAHPWQLSLALPGRGRLCGTTAERGRGRACVGRQRRRPVLTARGRQG